jgi:hypothetical protein
MTRVCAHQIVCFSIGPQRSEVTGCANGCPEGDLIHIAIFSLTAKIVLEVGSTSLRVRFDDRFARTDSRQKIQSP